MRRLASLGQVLGGAGFLLALVLLSATASCQHGLLGQPEPSTTPAPALGPVQHPIGHYTPGAVAFGVGVADLCPHLSARWAAARHGLSPGTQRLVRARYGLPLSAPVAEWDHLIPRELGGADTEANIWPMTIHAQDQRKDQLENSLHREVCTGRLELATAQQRARDFWLYW